MMSYFMLGCWALAGGSMGQYSADFLNSVSKNLSIGQIMEAHDLMLAAAYQSGEAV